MTGQSLSLIKHCCTPILRVAASLWEGQALQIPDFADNVVLGAMLHSAVSVWRLLEKDANGGCMPVLHTQDENGGCMPVLNTQDENGGCLPVLNTHLIQNQMHFEPTHSCQCSPLLPWVGSPELAGIYLPLCTLLNQAVCINHHGTPRSGLDTTVRDELQGLLTYKRFPDLVETNHGQQRPLLFSAAILN